MSDEKVSLRVATLNIWGLPDLLNGAPRKTKAYSFGYLTRSERMRRIISRIKDFDIICFQEVWLRSDRYELIKAGKEFGLSEWRYFHSGRMLSFLSKIVGFDEFLGNDMKKAFSGFGIGSGMLILSKYPICDTRYRPFTLCGKPQRVQHGDYQGSKGIGMITVIVENNLKVDIYTTHTVAAYALKDEYVGHRISNMIDYIEFIKEKEPNDLVIITGDLNNTPTSPEIQYFIRQLGLSDSFHTIHKEINIVTHFLSYKRLDYVFYFKKPSSGWEVKDSFLCFTNKNLEIEKSKVYGASIAPTTEPNPDDIFYSDHKGVCAEFIHNYLSKTKEVIAPTTNDIVSQVNGIVDKQIERAKKRRKRHIICCIAFTIVSLLIFSLPISGNAKYYFAILPQMYAIGCLFYATIYKTREIQNLQLIYKKL